MQQQDPCDLVIADDHQIVRAALRQALDSTAWQRRLPNRVVAEVDNGIDAIASIKAHKPDLLLLDIAMPMAGGAEVVHEAARWSPDTRAVIFTGISSPRILAGLVDSGVHGLFHKSAELEEMLNQLPLILRGGRYIDTYIQNQLGIEDTKDGLTQRERQVLNLLLGGRSNREIGGLLGISPKTVDKHRANIMSKLNVHSFAELMHYALSHGLIASLD